MICSALLAFVYRARAVRERGRRSLHGPVSTRAARRGGRAKRPPPRSGRARRGEPAEECRAGASRKGASRALPSGGASRGVRARGVAASAGGGRRWARSARKPRGNQCPDVTNVTCLIINGIGFTRVN